MNFVERVFVCAYYSWSVHIPGAQATIVPSRRQRERRSLLSLNTMADAPGSINEPLTFSRLPFDVRVIIYKLALTHGSTLDVSLFPSEESPQPVAPLIPVATVMDRTYLMPAILRVNKKINEEAMPYLYAHNTFSFVGLDECRAFTNATIPGRTLISRICLHRRVMSRPVCRWKTLDTFLPLALRQLTIELDTYSKSLLETCRSLCRGLAIYLRQMDDEQIRWNYFKHVLSFRFTTIRHLGDCIWEARMNCTIESQRPLWQRLWNAGYVSCAAVERCFKDLIEDCLIRDGVLGVAKKEVCQAGALQKANK